MGLGGVSICISSVASLFILPKEPPALLSPLGSEDLAGEKTRAGKAARGKTTKEMSIRGFRRGNRTLLL